MSKTKVERVKKDFGICIVACSPVRAIPSDASEMVSHLLFGETCKILERKRKSWIKIIMLYDGYTGWIDGKQIAQITEKELDKYSKNNSYVTDQIGQLGNHTNSIHVMIGATLPNFDGITLNTPLGKLTYNGKSIAQNQPIDQQEKFIKTAFKFINAPYLWGGRSLFGLDCSGFSQLLYKLSGFALPRDANQQAEIGELIDFVELTKPGDLAFFINDEGRVIHVGILLNNQEIIHCHGQVRVDLLDHEGIYNRESKKYSHKLHIIRRVLALKEPEPQHP